MSAVGVDRRKDHDMKRVEQGLDLRGGEILPAVGKPRIGGIGVQQVGCEIDRDLATTPLTCMDSADDHHDLAGARGACTESDRVRCAALDCRVRQCDELRQ